MDEDETPKKKQVSTLKSTNTSMNSVLDKLERVDLSVLSPEAVIKAQYFIIQYLKVIFFPLFTWSDTRYVLDINYLPSLQSLVEPKNIPAAVEKTLKVISDYNPASGDHEYDYDQDHMEPPNSPVFNSQSPCTRYDRAIKFPDKLIINWFFFYLTSGSFDSKLLAFLQLIVTRWQKSEDWPSAVGWPLHYLQYVL
jgi:hypothetical protein